MRFTMDGGMNGWWAGVWEVSNVAVAATSCRPLPWTAASRVGGLGRESGLL